MGVTSTRVPVRGEGTGSGRKGFWQSLREILSLCQFPSWSLAIPLLLWLWVVLSVLPSPLPSWHRQRRCCKTWKIFVISGTAWHRRLVRLKRSGRRCVSRCRTWGQLWEESWSLEQELQSKKDELAQLEARKEMLKASGFAPGVSVRAPGMSMGASAEPSAPKKKKKQNRHPGLPSQEGQEYYKSYLVHL